MFEVNDARIEELKGRLDALHEVALSEVPRGESLLARLSVGLDHAPKLISMHINSTKYAQLMMR